MNLRLEVHGTRNSLQIKSESNVQRVGKVKIQRKMPLPSPRSIVIRSLKYCVRNEFRPKVIPVSTRGVITHTILTLFIDGCSKILRSKKCQRRLRSKHVTEVEN